MPDWLRNAVFYEIYPQSFLDTDGDGIGNLNGVTQKLDYIRELGCNAVWLNPCFCSPFGDAGYDVADYCRVAPRYGTNADLAALFDAAHARGMHVLLDLVPGHTSVEHPWFRESLSPTQNAYSDRYIWTDSIWTSTEVLPCLRGISQRDGAVAVNFFSMQPALNYGFFERTAAWQQAPDAPGPMATRAAMRDVMRFWLRLGCDGFRVDMAGSLVKNDPDSTGNIALWQWFRAFLDAEFPDAALVSEWGEPEKSLRAGFHMDFLLQFGPSHYNDLFRCDAPYFSRGGKGTAALFVERYLESRTRAGADGLICIPSGNHDMDRLARRLDVTEQKLAFAFLCSMPGVPFLYYGDEIGLRQGVDCTSVEGGFGRTGARTPMQWNDEKNAGFSDADPAKLYIPQDDDPARPNVEAQMADEQSVWCTVQRLLALRRENPALQNMAEISFLRTGYPLCYLRSCPSQQILVAINPADQPCAEQFSGSLRLLATVGGTAEICADGFRLAGATAAFFVVTE